jgi:hypothetical protein
MPLQRHAGHQLLAALIVILIPAAVSAQPPQAAGRAERATQQLAALAARFEAEGRSPAAAAQLAAVAAERAALVQELMEADPAAVLRYAVPADLRSSLPADVQPFVEEHVTLEGEVTVFYEDYEQHSRLLHVLQTAGERLSLRIAGDVPDLQSDQRIRVRGVRLSGNLAADGGSIVPVTSALAYTFGEQRTLMILITFEDSTNPPYTVATAQQLLFSTVNDFMRENSQNQTWLTGEVAGWFPTTLSSTTCDSNGIRNAAREAATAAGYDLSNYRRFIYGFPKNACSWLGLGQVGGSTTHAWINGKISTRVVAHELGHNLGVYHARAMECGTTTLGSNCSTIEYGNPADIMGVSGTVAHFNAFKKERMGWLNYGSSAPLLTITGSGTYSIEPYAMVGSGIKGLKILKSTNTTTGRRTFYYVEYRGGGYGFDSSLGKNSAMQNGVMITIGTEASGNSSYALDMTPETSPWSDAPLPVGRTFSDPDADVNITPIAASSSGATVLVDFGPTCSYTVSPLSLAVGEGTGSGSASVTTDAGCAWTATSHAGWIAITAGSTGGGSGTTSYSIEANLSSNSRTGTLTVAGQTVTVTQAAATQSVTTVTALTASSASPLVAGTPVTWTATGSNNLGPVEYQFWLYRRTSWSMAQGYGPENTFTWTPQATDQGSPYYVQVWARAVGSTAPYEAWRSSPSYEVVPAPLSLAASVDFPTPPGNQVTWTATVTSPGTVPLEYRFFVRDENTGMSTELRGYSPDNRVQWTPQAAGSYVVQAWARAIGSTLEYEMSASTPPLDVAATPLTVKSLTADVSFPAQTGSPITWTARVQGGMSGPLQYQFWLYSAQTGAWSNAQPYGPSETFTWTPAPGEEGSYALQVWVRSNGSTAAYEHWRASGTFQIEPGEAPDTAAVWTAAVWTAAVPDTSTELEYQSWVHSTATGPSVGGLNQRRRLGALVPVLARRPSGA